MTDRNAKLAKLNEEFGCDLESELGIAWETILNEYNKNDDYTIISEGIVEKITDPIEVNKWLLKNDKLYYYVVNKIKEKDSREWVWSEAQQKRLLKWDKNIDHLWIEVFKRSVKVSFTNKKSNDETIYSRKQKQ